MKSFNHRHPIRAGAALLAGLVLVLPVATHAQEKFPKITPELMDELNVNLDTTWPTDPAVPDLPPMPTTDDPPLNPNAFLWTRFDDNIYPPRVKGSPDGWHAAAKA